MSAERTNLHKLWNALELMRSIHKEMPLQMASLFLFVAANGKPTMSQLADSLGISQSSCSRLTATLTDQYKDTQGNLRDGFGLLKSAEDPMERRRKIVTLTAQGKALATTLAEKLR
jgi:DNA-binding MarR family transcriptional regulator